MDMDIDWLRALCRSLPQTTERVQWNNHLVFKVCGKVYAIAALEVRPTWLTFKCSPEVFAELVERQGIVPAPYLARNKWVALESKDALPANELSALLRASHNLVIAKLPRKTREALVATRTIRCKAVQSERVRGKDLRAKRTGRLSD